MEIPIITTIISSTVVATVGIMTWFNGRANLKEQRVGERRKIIAKQLNEFYGPLISYLNITKQLYTILVNDKPNEFRTLTYLLDPTQTYEKDSQKIQVVLTESDKLILEEIIEIEQKIESLIIEKIGLIDDLKLVFEDHEESNFDQQGSQYDVSTSLATLVTHFRILRLAYEKKLEGEVARFKTFVFPREVNRVVVENYNKLHRELRGSSR